MPLLQEGALDSCQRIETMLREVQRLALVPRTEMLTECEAQLGVITAQFETLHRLVRDEAANDSGTVSSVVQSNPALRSALQQIQRTVRTLKAQFDHGSNYCMGLLQVRLGAGYSEQGRPVLIPTAARSSFEG
jgi:hypothetical protein